MARQRIVVFGASGYTGGLVADALASRPERDAVDVVVAGRDADRLAPVAERVGAEVLVADATAPTGDLTAALRPGDVLVSTVGPFASLGAPAVEAALASGAHYIDSTGEGNFIRRVFEEWGPKARGRSLLLTAFGYDYVPGCLAGALAVDEAGPAAAKVDVGYFFTGRSDPRSAMSSGTLATVMHMATAPGFAYRDGRLHDARTAQQHRAFDVAGKTLRGVSVPSTEAFDLPAAYPQLTDVQAYIGWFGPANRFLPTTMRAGRLVTSLPLVSRVVDLGRKRLAGRTGIGPDEAARSTSGSLVVAEARDAAGRPLATARLDGPNGYTLTGDLIAWAAARLATDPPKVTGAHGPVGAFGLEDLTAGCASVGLAAT